MTTATATATLKVCFDAFTLRMQSEEIHKVAVLKWHDRRQMITFEVVSKTSTLRKTTFI